MKPQIPWLRVFVEGVVIVGSILLAFGIQAWWDERQERGEERGEEQQLLININLHEELGRARVQSKKLRLRQTVGWYEEERSSCCAYHYAKRAVAAHNHSSWWRESLRNGSDIS